MNFEDGTLTIEKAGTCALSVRPRADPQWKVIGLQSITLSPVN